MLSDTASLLLLQAVAQGDVEQCQTLIVECRANVRYRNALGECSLHVAAHRGLVSVAELLLAFGADPNVVTYTKYGGRSPLHIAVANNCARLVQLLLEHDADPNVQDCTGGSALHVAVHSYGAVPNAQKATMAGHSDTNSSSSGGGSTTTLKLSYTEQLSCSIAELLLRHGANIGIEDTVGLCARDYAKQRNLAQMIRVLDSIFSFREDVKNATSGGGPMPILGNVGYVANLPLKQRFEEQERRLLWRMTKGSEKK